MAKKAFLLRMDPELWAAVERLAQKELRSANAEIEFLLREALARRGVRPHEGAPRDEMAGGDDPVRIRQEEGKE
jgi:hypothetical protein